MCIYRFAVEQATRYPARTVPGKGWELQGAAGIVPCLNRRRRSVIVIDPRNTVTTMDERRAHDL
jgi:hypothetical protein